LKIDLKLTAKEGFIMSIKQASVGTLQKGNYVIIDGIACRVVDTQTSKPGKHGHAKVRVIAAGLLDGRKREVVMPGHDNIDVPIIEKKNAQILSISENMANVMDAETYETFDIEIPEEMKEDAKEGKQILYWQILEQKVMKQVKSE
jgi:translation initiation factor 5A